ncbi:hypothetical protein [Agriterribacter sp.]|uniref:hypothetical protein n=1 Tax=Agriterribacter sp. TaxID=2821509 RepID=UPI002C8A6067|nr:hypothetical protein [Agriterribacter sp.]HRO44952.1 hypothetical protein [Agriterribacter sp.]HRQ15690.1 hypothetical protein [Agriterribacter sp.]
MKRSVLNNSIFIIVISLFGQQAAAQMITGVWHGKINRQKVELKLIQKGDSLTGTSYYFQSPGNYRRYSIKGFFDGPNNVAVWWDDELLEEKSGRTAIGSPGKDALLSQADFNCPGGGIMKLEGEASLKEDENRSKGEVRLDKTNHPSFYDEWDFIIENFTAGANDPYIIDSVGLIARQPAPVIAENPVVITTPVIKEKVNPPAVAIQPQAPPVSIAAPLTIEQKFTQRQKIPVLEIPLSGDSIELNFYDNAEIDGDSITLFLNDRLIFQHIYLTDKPFIVKLPVNELQQSNELVMVAENLGSIPPNTSFMVAYIGEKRYEARLESNEGSSAMIRFVKKSE